MIDQCMEVGDEVLIIIPQENRGYGHNPCPDGTKAMILGFSETHHGRLDNFGFRPGVYVNRAWVKVRLPDGREYLEYSSRLELADKAEYEKRVAEFRNLQASNPNYWRDNKDFIRDLPETPFWEGDRVLVRGYSMVPSVYAKMPPGHDPHVFTIIKISFDYLTERTRIGTKCPAYAISDKLGACWNTSASEDRMELIERGPVWKFYNNEPIVFGDIKEEATFFEMLGHTDEVRNPGNDLFKWNQKEVLKAIRQGLVHSFSVNGPSICAKRFRNEELGRRVAQAKLEEFGIA